MDIKTEREAFEAWYCRNHTGLKQSDLAKFRTLSGYSFSDSLKINISWEAWQAAKAQAVPENKIEFDGEYIKYPNSYAIHCQFDEDFDCHIFDVYQNEDCVKDGMTQLKQAHLFVFSMSEAQEPAND